MWSFVLSNHRRLVGTWLLVCALAVWPACDSELAGTGGRSCTSTESCGAGESCVAGRCVPVIGGDGGLDAADAPGDTLPGDTADAPICQPGDPSCICEDPDGDGYGEGEDCLGIDCDETRTNVHSGYAEVCDDLDNDCDGSVDEDFGGDLTGTPCGTCDGGTWACGVGEFECVDESGEDVLNVCGGCAELEYLPGQRCGLCGSGRLECDGTEALTCTGEQDDWITCGETCCPPTQTCLFDACVEDEACAGDEDCLNDTYCDPDIDRCIPYGHGPRDESNPECQRIVIVARFAPTLQCSWEGPPEGDANPAWRNVLTTPLVADFDFDDDPEVIRPTIVFTTDDGSDGSSELPTGLIRLIDGRDCSEQFNLDMQWTSHSSPPAVADLTGDGTPEIVAYKAGGGLVAFHYVRAEERWEILWTSHLPGGAVWEQTGGGWGGPGIHDLDGDGTPEVLRGGVVFSNTGELIDASLGYLTHGSAPANMSAAVDLDGDGLAEVASGDGVWGWNPETDTWQAETWFSGSGLARGHVALADFGDFPLENVDYPEAPEVAVVWSGQIRLQTIEGDVVFGPVALPGGGSGGPPTAGDFDGDGRPELAAASQGSYTVFDLDCTGAGTIETCPTQRTDGILWTVPSQDFSSSSTGSSIFDFEGDGAAEAIYADECFVRVYDGSSGDVIFSQFTSSCTWHENPIVADVDGDFNSELVVPSNLNCGTGDQGRPCDGLEAGAIDPQFPGIRCEENADCVSGVCGEGFCRCTVTDDCCLGGCGASAFVCAAPPAGTPGEGNTCRAAHPRGLAGIRVYSDTLDRWVNSRPIWNQHAYFVTNVNDDGTIPPGDATPNWEVPSLNNFRQNTQGDGVLDAPDLTGNGGPGYVCDPKFDSAVLSALVCNRGTEPVDSGVDVTFTAAGVSEPLCAMETERPLAPGECESLTCIYPEPPQSAPGVDVTIAVDASNGDAECLEGNNAGVVAGVYCLP